MISEEQAQLERERAIGDEYARVFDAYIKPFIEEKQRVLFEAFCSIPVSNVEQLKDVRMQATAIAALEAHFKEFITTGELAKKQLES